MPLRHFTQHLVCRLNKWQHSKKSGKEQNRCMWSACQPALPLRIHSVLIVPTEANMKQLHVLHFRRDVSAHRLKVMFMITDRFQNCDLALVEREPHFPCLYLSKLVPAPNTLKFKKGVLLNSGKMSAEHVINFANPKCIMQLLTQLQQKSS